MYRKFFINWSILMLFMTLPLVIASCGTDDEENLTDAELIAKAKGHWMCTESSDTYEGRTAKGLIVGKEITIYTDGTYKSNAPTFGASGTYTVNGNKITARNNLGDVFVINVTISGDRMSWIGTSNDGVSFSYQFISMDNTRSASAVYSESHAANSTAD